MKDITRQNVSRQDKTRKGQDQTVWERQRRLSKSNVKYPCGGAIIVKDRRE